VTVDLESNTVKLPSGVVVEFQVEAFARFCLLNGTDELGYLLKQSAAITRHEQAHA
jgi:3-isopropylmalate/(R)-2-methylmalate dehydratase small subunit